MTRGNSAIWLVGLVLLGFALLAESAQDEEFIRPVVKTGNCGATLNVDLFLATPFVDVDDVESRLSCLQFSFLQSNDPKGVFLAVYLQVTIQMNIKLKAGFFHDGAWVGKYLVCESVCVLFYHRLSDVCFPHLVDNLCRFLPTASSAAHSQRSRLARSLGHRVRTGFPRLTGT
jgi:hypothetical protein